MVSNTQFIRDLIEKLKGSLAEWQKQYSNDLDLINLDELELNYDSYLYVKVPYGAEIPELFITGPIYRYLMNVRNILKYLDEGINLEIHNGERYIEKLYLLAILYNHALEQKKKDSKSRDVLSLQPLNTAILKLRKMMNIVDEDDFSKCDPRENLAYEIFDKKTVMIDDSIQQDVHNQIVHLNYGGLDNYNRAIAHLNVSKKAISESITNGRDKNREMFKTSFKKKKISVENESLEKENTIPQKNADDDLLLDM